MGCGASAPASNAGAAPVPTSAARPAAPPASASQSAAGAAVQGLRQTSVSVKNLPESTFTISTPIRDVKTGGITTSVLKDFQFGKVLGTGGFAVVKQAQHLRTKQKYAIKIVDVSPDGADDEGMTLDEIAEEIRLTMSLKHENIVKIYDFYQSKTNVYVIMELLFGGELLDLVMKLGSYGERDAMSIMKQLFYGLESVHSANITHRDLKLENLILAEKDNINSLRIADFGLAKKMKTARGKLAAQCGSPAYVAPEVITGQQYTPAVDMWASGVILYALLCGELPFFDDDEQKMFRLIAKGKMHPLPEGISPEAQDLIKKLLCVDRVKRLTAGEATEHPWIARGEAIKTVKTSLNKSRLGRFAGKSLTGELETRDLKVGDYLIKQGERAKEVYLIKEGSCEVVVEQGDGTELKVAERHAGEFVGEMGIKLKADGATNEDAKDEPGPAPKPEKKKKETKGESSGEGSKGGMGKATLNIHMLIRVKNTWLGGRRTASIRAVTPMKVLVMSAKQMQWILEHDYGADGEVSVAISKRKAELKSISMAPDRANKK